MDFSSLVSAVDFSSTGVALLAIGAVWMAVEVVYRGVWMVLDMVRGDDGDNPYSGGYYEGGVAFNEDGTRDYAESPIGPSDVGYVNVAGNLASFQERDPEAYAAMMEDAKQYE